MRYVYILIVMGTLVAAGCGGVRDAGTGNVAEPAVKKDVPSPAAAGEKLVAYFGYVRKLPSAQLAKEFEVARQSYTATRSDFDRMRYAMILSIPGSASYDDARAFETIEPLLKNQSSPLHALAFMVNAQIQEQRRGQGLQQKLDALNSLEKNLSERDTGGARKK